MSKELVKNLIEETTEKLLSKRECRTCIFSNETCDWCMENKIKINGFMYGCGKYMTRQDAIRKHTEILCEEHCKDFAKTTLDMDTMGYTINAASIMLEKIDRKLDASYKSIKHPTSEEEKNHKESKKQRDRLLKAYNKMRFCAMDMRNTFDDYVEYFFTYQFTDEAGKYNESESDKNLVNSGIIAKFVKLLVDRCLDNKENGELILKYMLSLKGSGVYEEKDFNEMMING